MGRMGKIRHVWQKHMEKSFVNLLWKQMNRLETSESFEMNRLNTTP